MSRFGAENKWSRWSALIVAIPLLWANSILFIYLFIGTCTSGTLQFFTNAPQMPEQMSMSMSITIT
jgi:uncharacterized membrane protein YdfJ with MMPL/SSD domain